MDFKKAKKPLEQFIRPSDAGLFTEQFACLPPGMKK